MKAQLGEFNDLVRVCCKIKNKEAWGDSSVGKPWVQAPILKTTTINHGRKQKGSCVQNRQKAKDSLSLKEHTLAKRVSCMKKTFIPL